MKTRYIRNIGNIKQLSAGQRKQLEKVTDKFQFCVSSYYLSLIDWDDPDDPLKRLVIPDLKELNVWGALDPSNEKKYTVMPGFQHKYGSVAVLLVSDKCACNCRFCFRKRVLKKCEDAEIMTLKRLPRALRYIEKHKEITNVLLTGGDPMVLSTKRLEKFIKPLFEIDHVGIVRIGTKILSYDPWRIINDPAFCRMVKKYSDTVGGKKIYMMTHFSHSNEITKVSRVAISRLQSCGVELRNQTPLIKGINDKPEILAKLFNELSFVGVSPYYVFQCRPALGNKEYAVPIEKGYRIFEKAKAKVSGLAKTCRFAMSHATGKLEIIGLGERWIYFKYHRAAEDDDSGGFVKRERNPKAYWFDDYDHGDDHACSLNKPL